MKLDLPNNDIKTYIPFTPMKADGDYEFIKDLEYEDVLITDVYWDDESDLYGYASVKWDAAIEKRSYGIKDVHFYTVQVQVKIFDSKTDELIKQIDTDVDDSWETSDENSHIELGSTIHPRSIEVNQVDKIIYINW